MQMFFEVGLFTGAIWLSGLLGTTSLAANQIALSLASLTFMFAMGLSVAVTIRWKSERTYGLCEIAARGAIHILLAILLETVFAVIFIVFLFTSSFCKC
jgi:MATE family multidrug resistance protein